MSKNYNKKPFEIFMGEGDAIDDAWELLSPRINPLRREKMRAIAQQRTPYLRLCLQDVHDPHNIGACLRSAEANGLQYCDFVNLYSRFPRPSKTARGANHWLHTSRFRGQKAYIDGIKARGYKIAAAFPAAGAYELDALPIDQPLMVLFGNEADGVDESWSEHIDYRFTIPMWGMVESYNVSVATALTLYSLSSRCRRELPPEKFLADASLQRDLLNHWITRSARSYQTELEKERALKATRDRGLTSIL